MPASTPIGSAVIPAEAGAELLRFDPPPRKPTGTSGHWLPAGFPDYEKNGRLAQMRDRILAYRVAERHPAVMVGLQVWHSLMLAGKWSVNPANDSPEAVAYAEHIARSLGIRTESLGGKAPPAMLGKPWESRLLELLLSERYGWHWWELVCEDIDGVRYTHMLWRDPASTFQFVTDGLERLVAIRQLPVTGLGGMRTVPMGRVLLMGREQVGTQWDGIGILRGIEPMVGDSNRTANILAVTVERWGCPTPLITADVDVMQTLGITPEQAKADVATWQAWGEQYISGERQSCAPPPWVKVGAYDGDKSARNLPDLIATLDAQDRRILQAFLAQFLMLGAAGSGGSYSLGQVHSDAASTAAENVLQRVAEQLKSYMLRALSWQFGDIDPAKMPTLEIDGIRSPLWTERLNELVALINAGVVTPTTDMAAEILKRLQFDAVEPERSPAQRLSGRALPGPVLPTPKTPEPPK